MQSIMDKNVDLFKLFLKNDAEVDLIDKYGNSALFYSVMADSYEMTSILLKVCKKVKFLNKDNKSIYDYV